MAVAVVEVVLKEKVVEASVEEWDEVSLGREG